MGVPPNPWACYSSHLYVNQYSNHPNVTYLFFQSDRGDRYSSTSLEGAVLVKVVKWYQIRQKAALTGGKSGSTTVTLALTLAKYHGPAVPVAGDFSQSYMRSRKFGR